MDRRQFLKILSGTAAVAVGSQFIPYALSEIDPEFELWIPGAKSIFLPPEKQIIAPEKPTIFSAVIDLDRAMRDKNYFIEQVIGDSMLKGETAEDLYREYFRYHPAHQNPFNKNYLA